MPFTLPLLTAAALHCTAVDGDTLRCGRERVRLTGIDAPELPGHCARYRRCVAGDGDASRRHLAALMRGRTIELTRIGKDHYGRTLAIAFAGGVNLACAQIRAGHAIYKPWWDDGRRIGKACGLKSRDPNRYRTPH